MNQSKHTLPELLFNGLENHPGGLFCATKRGGTWHNTDLSDFSDRVRNMALGLYELGVRPGDKVSIHSENSTEWLICDLAVLSMGAANVPIYTTQPGEQIKYILENSDSKVHIVSDDEMFAETKPLIKGIKSVKAVISIQPSRHKKLKGFEDVLKMGEELDQKEPDLYDSLQAEIQPDDLATLIYTSGTTGLPKGVMLTHNNIASNVRASLEKLPFAESEFHGQNVLSYLPLSHVFERMIEYMYISMGCRIYYIEEVEQIRDDFGYVKPFFFATVPRLMEKIHTGVKVRGQEFSGLKKSIYYWAIYKTEKYDPENPPKGPAKLLHAFADRKVYSKIREMFGGNLKGMVSGGAALSPEVFKFMNAIGFICVQGYGLTETSPVITVQTPGAMRIGTSGKPIRDVEVKIADDGEILTRGPNVMKGYYKNEEQTREVMTGDGWFKTGDIGKIDEDGYLFITDRKKSMFKLSTGKYVAPQNVENHVAGSGFIEQAVVIGYQRKFCSALIVPAYDNVLKRLKRDGYEPAKPYSDDEKVRELIQQEVDKANRQVAPWESVKKFKLLDDQLTIDDGELTPTMKVKRPVVLEKFKDEIDAMYADE
jgi:long-chain acyl-CoA synthetase